MKVTVEIDLEEVIDESSYREISFKEEFTKSLKYAIVKELKEQCKEAVLKQISEPILEQTRDITEGVAKELLEADLKTHKFKFYVNYSEKEATISELVSDVIDKWTREKIVNIIQEKAKKLVEEIRNRYDMTFAALIVDNMKKQNLLADERLAALLSQSTEK